MKKFLFIFLIFSVLSHSVKSDIFGGSHIKSTKKIVEKLPFHIFKKTAKKISHLGLKRLGLAAFTAALFSEISSYEVKKDTIKNRYSKNNIKKINAKGQIYINNINENEAKKRALEDALYFASMKGGVKVHGFSSIDHQTNLKESFAVKPDNKILDYKILKSYRKDDIYIVEIEALIGKINKDHSFCSKRKVISIKEFKGNKTLNSNIPAWSDNYLNTVLDSISNNLEADRDIEYLNHKSVNFDFNKGNFDKSFDYRSLVNGMVSVETGEFIYIPSIKIIKSKFYPETFWGRENKSKYLNLLDTDVLDIGVKVDIYEGVKNNLAFQINENYLIPLNTDSNFELIEMITKNDKEYLDIEVQNVARDVYEIIKAKLECMPLITEVKYTNNKLRVPVGQNQGLRKDQLALIETNNVKELTMLAVSEIYSNSSVLTPLNSKVVLRDLDGANTRFLE
tara:strand:- start:567 stop:1922 length:1356 start_codon:yes stop_codon:yes gene_type:complete